MTSEQEPAEKAPDEYVVDRVRGLLDDPEVVVALEKVRPEQIADLETAGFTSAAEILKFLKRVKERRESDGT